MDHKPHVKRKSELYGILGRCGIFPRKMHVGKGVFYPIINEEDLEEILKEESVNKAKENGFEIYTPIEYGAMRMVVVKEIDEMIDDYSKEKIMANIELNSWAKVMEIYKMPTTSKMIKVQFKSTQMVQKAAAEGIAVLYQKIPPKKIEKEIFVRLTPCNNCFGYTHETKNCEKRKMTLCAYYAGEGHRQQQCTAMVPKCINCGEEHRTLAAQCPIRKGLIKDKRKAIRDRSKSRGRSAARAGIMGGISYANMAGTNAQEKNKGEATDPKEKEELKELTTTILSAIIFSRYMESIVPGSFQKNMNEMYRLNGLKTMNFPTINVTGMKEIYSSLIKEIKETEKEDVIEDGVMEESEMELGAEATAKRSRELSTPPAETNETKKKREMDKQGEQKMALKIPPQMKPPVPPPPKPVTITVKAKTVKEKETTEKLERSIENGNRNVKKNSRRKSSILS